MARFMFYKVTLVAVWRVDKERARVEAKKPVRRS